MKIQCDVEEQVWRSARVYALEKGLTMGEVVVEGLGRVLGEQTPVRGAEPVIKVAPEVAGRTAGATPATGATPEPENFPKPKHNWRVI